METAMMGVDLTMSEARAFNGVYLRLIMLPMRPTSEHMHGSRQCCNSTAESGNDKGKAAHTRRKTCEMPTKPPKRFNSSKY